MTPKSKHLVAINAAELAGFSNYAAALLALYRSLPDERALRWIQYVGRAHRLPTERAERDGASTGISK